MPSCMMHVTEPTSPNLFFLKCGLTGYGAWKELVNIAEFYGRGGRANNKLSQRSIVSLVR